MDRRTFLGAGLALATAPALAARRESAAARLIRRMTVIDGNLVVPLDPDGPLTGDIAAQIRASGLHGDEADVGRKRQPVDDGNAGGDRGHRPRIAASPKLIMKVRSAADFARAKAKRAAGDHPVLRSGGDAGGQSRFIDRFARQGRAR